MSPALFLASIDGFGASYSRADDCWHIYTMPGTKSFCTVRGYDKEAFESLLLILRFAHEAAKGGA